MIFIVKIMFSTIFIFSGVFLACLTNKYDCNDSYDVTAKIILYLIVLLYMFIGIKAIL